jgi:small-conductance mechanosensitive channel
MGADYGWDTGGSTGGSTGGWYFPEIHHSWFQNHLLPAAVLVLGAGLIVRFAHWIGARRRHWVDEQIRIQIESGLVASEALKRSRAVSEAVEWVVVALVGFITAILALDRLGIPLTTLVAPATVIGIGLGFGAQQMVGDLLAGFFLFAEHQFAFGDVIRLSVPGQATGITGTVEELTLRVTKVRTAQGELVVVPNSALRQVTNLSKDWSRAVVDIPVAVTEDLAQVTGLLKDMFADMAADREWSELLLGDPVVAGVETIDVGYVQLRLIARTLPGRQFEVAREIRLRATTVLRSAGVSSPSIADGP